MSGGWAWARAEIRGRWRALVAVGVLIGLMAAMVLTALAGARRTSSSYERFRARTHAHDAAIFTSDHAGLVEASRLPGVEVASVGTIFPAFVDLQEEFDFGILAGYDANLGRRVDTGVILGGRLPDPDRIDEVALNPQASAALRAGPGDRIRLGTITPAQRELIMQGENPGEPAGPELSLEVTGVLRNADDLRGDLASHLIYGTPAFRAAYDGTVASFSDFAAIRLRGGQGAYDDFAERARTVVGAEGEVSINGSAELSESVHDSLRVLAIGLVFLAVASFLVGAVAGAQALGRQLWMAAPAQTALGALGLTVRSRAAAAALVSVVTAGVASLTALAGALVGSSLTPISVARQAEPDPGIAFDPLVHLLGAAATGALVLGAALLVGWQVARNHATEPPARARPSAATRVAGSVGLGPAATTGLRLALERGGGRTALPVRSALLAATVAVAGLAGTATFGASLDRLTTTPARFGAPWDIQPEEFEYERAAELPDTQDVGVVNRAGVVFADGAGATAYAMEVIKGDPTFTITRGRAPLTAREVALGPDQLERLDVAIGDEVVFRGDKGPSRARVVGETVVPAVDQDPMAGGVVVTPELFAAVTEEDGVATNAAIRWRDDVPDAVALARFKRANPGVYNAYAAPRMPGEVVNLGRIASLPNAFGAFLALVGVAGLLHALVTSARRRRRDLAVLRTMGFVRHQLRASLSWQSTAIAVSGLVLGIPFGVAAGRWLWMVVAGGIGVATDPLVPALAAAALVPAVVVLANLVALPLGVRAGRITPAAVLRTE